YRDAQRQPLSEPEARSAVQVPWPPAPGRRVRPSVTTRTMSFIPSLPPQAIDGDQAADCFTFYLAPDLLLATVHTVICGATGILVWVRREGHAERVTPSVHPALLVRGAYEAPQAEHIALVPHLPTCDPLRHHIALVLQAQRDANSVAGHLY